MSIHISTSLEWLVVTLVMLIVIILKRKNYTPISVYGMGLGAVVCWCINKIVGENNDPLSFNSSRFMYILLPPIVLFSGLRFDYMEASDTIGTSAILAWLGTIGSALWVSLAMWPYVDHWILAFWIGSVLGPTDVALTLDQLKSVGKIPMCLVLEHESILNDATALMMVHMCERVWYSLDSITKTESMEIVTASIGMTVIASVVGVVGGWSLCRSGQCSAQIVIVLGIFLFAFGEQINGSGVITLFVFGASIRKFSSEESRESVMRLVRDISELSEVYMYVTVGGILSRVELGYVVPGLCAILACTVGRIMNVFFFGNMIKIGGIHWSLEELMVMSTCGIRGAVSLALAATTPVEFQSLFLTITAMEVVFSMFSSMLVCRYFVPLIPNESSA